MCHKIVLINTIDIIKKYLLVYLLEKHKNNDCNEIEDNVDHDSEENTVNYNRGSRCKYIYLFLFIYSTNNIRRKDN
jgi:hypothetical protein